MMYIPSVLYYVPKFRVLYFHQLGLYFDMVVSKQVGRNLGFVATLHSDHNDLSRTYYGSAKWRKTVVYICDDVIVPRSHYSKGTQPPTLILHITA